MTSVETIRGWHKKNGWRDIGYHRVILHDDAIPQSHKPIQHWSTLVKQGRELDDNWYMTGAEQGAHTKGFNGDSIGICVVGNTDYTMTEWQKVALKGALDVLVKRYGLKKEDVFGHRDFNATKCPGDEIYKFIQEYKKEE